MTEFTTRPTLRGTFGMVSSTHWLASQSGMAVLEAGGNAFDAAVAAAFVLQVVEPHLNGPGGEFVALLARGNSAATGPMVLCGQGPAPAAATIDHYRSLGFDLVPGAGPLAAAVPGAVDGWLTLLRDHGTLPLPYVLSYAIGYARDGYPIVPRACEVIGSVETLFSDHWPTSAKLWLVGGRVPEPYSLHRNPAWADTLVRLVELSERADGSRERAIDAALAAWREGFVAQEVADFQRLPHRDSSGRAHPGLITVEDMATFRPTYEPPVLHKFRGYTVAKAGPWTQGPVLLQTLAILDELPDTLLDPSNPDGVHTIAEAMKLAFADRDAWYGDGADVPLDDLLSPAYAARRRDLIGTRASDLLRPGAPGGRSPRLPRHVQLQVPPLAAVDATLGEPAVSRSGEQRTVRARAHTGEGGDTCHVSVVDRRGNIIAATPSGGWLHSSPTIPELGFCLGSRAQMFWLEEGLPSALAPGRRPRTTLTPTLVLRGGAPVLGCGSPGGDQQEQWQLLFLLRHLVHDMDPQAAIDAPMWHTTSVAGSFYPRDMMPAGLVVEERLGSDAIAELERRGHRVTVSDPWSLGRMCVVGRDQRTGTLSAAANPRGMQGYACGR